MAYVGGEGCFCTVRDIAEGTGVGEEGEGGVVLREVGELREVAEEVVFAFAAGAEDGDGAGVAGSGVAEGFGEVIGVLLVDFDEAVGKGLLECGGEAVAIADDGVRLASVVDEVLRGAITADDGRGVLERE